MSIGGILLPTVLGKIQAATMGPAIAFEQAVVARTADLHQAIDPAVDKAH